MFIFNCQRIGMAPKDLHPACHGMGQVVLMEVNGKLIVICRDYVGGPLTSFLYAIPLIKDTRSSWITSNCLRNSGIWPNQRDFLNEYLAIHVPNDCSRLLQVKIMETRKKDLFSKMLGGTLFPMTEYIKWHRLRNKAYVFHDLLPRSTLQKWLSQLFFKVSVFSCRFAHRAYGSSLL